MSYNPSHNMQSCGRPPQHPLTFGELDYTAKQINELLSLIPFKADRAEVPEMEKLSDVNYLGHVADATLLPEQEQPSWALVGNIEAARPYFFYVEDFVPKGYQPGWNDLSQALGTYNLTALNEVYHTKLLSRFGSYEQIDGAAVTEQDIQEIARIIKAVQNNKTVSFFYEPDAVTFNYFGTLDCYYNSSKTEFGCYLPTSDGYVIARCNISKPDKWALVLSSCDNEVSNSKNYNSLKGRPAINGVTLSGNHKPSELDLATLTEFNTLKKDVTEVSSDAQQKAEYAVETSDEARSISVSAESKSDTAVATSNEAKRISEIARNAVTTLEGLANATTAAETLAGQVVQIEENKQNIAESGSYVRASKATFVQGGYLINGMNIGDVVNFDVDYPATSTPWGYAIITVSKGDVVEISGIGMSGIRLWYALDSEQKIVDISKANLTLDKFQKEITEENVRYIVVQDSSSRYECYIEKKDSLPQTIKEVNKLKAGLDYLEDVVEEVKPITNIIKSEFTWVLGKFISSGGTINSSSTEGVKYCEPTQVYKGDSLRIYGIGTGYTAIGQYNAETGNYIPLKKWNDIEEEIVYTFEEDMLFSISGVMLEEPIILRGRAFPFVNKLDITQEMGESTDMVVSQYAVNKEFALIKGTSKIDFIAGRYLIINKTVGDVVDFNTDYPSSSNPWGYAIVPVQLGDKVIISGSGLNTIRLWYELDSEQKIISCSEGNATLAGYEKKIEDKNTTYIVIQDSTGLYNCSILKVETLKSINERLDRLENGESNNENGGNSVDYELLVRKTIPSFDAGTTITLSSATNRAVLKAVPPFRVKLDDNFTIRSGVYVNGNVVYQRINNPENREIFIESFNGDYDNCYLVINRIDGGEISDGQDIIKKISPYKEGRYEDYSEGAIPLMFNFKEIKNGGLSVVDSEVSEAVKHSEMWLRSYGVLRLPSTYSANGKKTRLIIFAHGSGDPRPTLDFYNDYLPYIEYLTKEGYAVADCWSWGTRDGYTKPIGSQFFCSPTNYACYNAFYTHLMEHFNFHKEIFMYGKSLGGLQVVSLPYVTSIPVIACCLMSCQTSPLMNLWGYDDIDRMECLKDFGCSGLEQDAEGNYIGEGKCMLTDYYTDGTSRTELTEERKSYLLSNADKFQSFTPFAIRETKLSFEDVLVNKNATLQGYLDLSPCMTAMKPIISFVAKRDAGVTLATEKFTYGCRKSGNIAQIRYVPDEHCESPHHAVDTESVMISVKTKYGETVDNVPIAYAEMVDFFRRFGD